MSYENLRHDCLSAIHVVLQNLNLPIPRSKIVLRNTFLADGLTLPCIVVSPFSVESIDAPAGRRARIISTMVSCYFLGNEDPAYGMKEQLYTSEVIEAEFQFSDLDGVPRVQQNKVVKGDDFLMPAFRNNLNTLRIMVRSETCEGLGVENV